MPEVSTQTPAANEDQPGPGTLDMQPCHMPPQAPLTAPAHEPTDEDETYMYNELVDNDVDPDAGASSVYSQHENEYPFDYDDDNSIRFPDTGARAPPAVQGTRFCRGISVQELTQWTWTPMNSGWQQFGDKPTQ